MDDPTEKYPLSSKRASRRESMLGACVFVFHTIIRFRLSPTFNGKVTQPYHLTFNGGLFSEQARFEILGRLSEVSYVLVVKCFRHYNP